MATKVEALSTDHAMPESPYVGKTYYPGLLSEVNLSLQQALRHQRGNAADIMDVTGVKQQPVTRAEDLGAVAALVLFERGYKNVLHTVSEEADQRELFGQRMDQAAKLLIDDLNVTREQTETILDVVLAVFDADEERAKVYLGQIGEIIEGNKE